jgi:class 3 adenylate cyclase
LVPRSFVLTDIVDSVSLWERDAELMAEAVARHDAIVSREVNSTGGTLVRCKGEGDSTFSVFHHPAEAVAATIAIQGAIAAEEWPAGLGLRVRVGVHTGDAEPRDGDWYGPAVNRAARLRSLAAGGQTLVSGVTAGLVADRMPTSVRLLYRGRRVLRGIERPEEVWEIVAADDPRAAVPRLAKASDMPLARTRFVGRAVELALLDELLGQAWAGEPVTVLICGEAGAGKTRLIAKVAARPVMGGLTRWRGTARSSAAHRWRLLPSRRSSVCLLGTSLSVDRTAPVGSRLDLSASWPGPAMERGPGTRLARICSRGTPRLGCSRRCSTPWSTPRRPAVCSWSSRICIGRIRRAGVYSSFSPAICVMHQSHLSTL